MVVDASVAITWFIMEPGHDEAVDIVRSGDMLIAPDFTLIEVMNVLRRKQRQGKLSEKQLGIATETIGACFSQLVPALSLLRRTVDLSETLDHSVDDCTDLACALTANVTLMTADRVFATKATKADMRSSLFS